MRRFHHKGTKSPEIIMMLKSTIVILLTAFLYMGCQMNTLEQNTIIPDLLSAKKTDVYFNVDEYVMVILNGKMEVVRTNIGNKYFACSYQDGNNDLFSTVNVGGGWSSGRIRGKKEEYSISLSIGFRITFMSDDAFDFICDGVFCGERYEESYTGVKNGENIVLMKRTGEEPFRILFAVIFPEIVEGSDK